MSFNTFKKLTTPLRDLALPLSFSALLLGGCATAPYVPTLYDASISQVETIAIADDSIPDKVGANELASAMGTGQAAGGLIGTLVVAAMEGAETSGRMKNLAELLEPTGFDAEAEFEAMLKAKLAEAGYGDLSIVDGERKGRSALKTLPETSADAVLDVNMHTFGMQKAKTGEEWRPAAGITVRLVSSGTEDVLAENVISYNSGVAPESGREGIIVMQPAATSVGYMKIKEMDADIVVEEMRSMLDEVSDMIVSLLA